MDLNWTQAQWNDLFIRLGNLIRTRRELKTYFKRFSELRCIVTEHLDDAAQLSDWNLNDVVIGVDTDINGYVYVSLTDAAGTRTVDVYNDDARTNLVATGSGADGTITLVAEAGYTINGSVFVAYTGDDTDIWLKLENDFRLLLNQIFTDTSIIEQDFVDYMRGKLASISKYIKSGYTVIDNAIEEFILNFISNKINSTFDYSLQTDETDVSGTVTIENEGIIPDLIDAMNDDGNAGAQDLMENTVAGAGMSADADNVGSVDISARTLELYPWVREGNLVLRCVEDTIGAIEFEVSIFDSENEEVLDAANNLMPQADWADNEIGIKKLNIAHDFTSTGSGDWDHFSDWVVTGESEDNSDGGKWYGKWIDTTDTLEFYSDSARSNLVASGTLSSFPGTITCTEQNNSGLTIVAAVSADPGANINDGVLEGEYSKIGDKYYEAITNDHDGVFVSELGELYKVEFPSSGTPTIDDAYAERS